MFEIGPVCQFSAIWPLGEHECFWIAIADNVKDSIYFGSARTAIFPPTAVMFAALPPNSHMQNGFNMCGIELMKLLVACSLCFMPTIATAKNRTPPQRTLVISQPSDSGGEDVVDVMRVCMHGDYAVAYHAELDRYGNAVHPPSVFNIKNQCWWDADKRQWITKNDWARELEKAKKLATKMFSSHKDSKNKKALIWSLEPEYTIVLSGKLVRLSSAWVEHGVTSQGEVTEETLASFFGFHRLMLIRNSIDQRKGLPFIWTVADNALFEAGVLPKRVTTKIHIGSMNVSTWTEYQFRDATPGEISESTRVIASLPPLHKMAESK